MRIVGFSQVLFAAAFASVAVLSLSYGNFVPVGQPFPAWIPWREVWVYGFALLVLAASAGLCVPRTAVAGALAICAYETVWAVMSAIQIPANPLSVGAWYPFCEALTALAGAGILYIILRSQSAGSALPAASRRAVRVAQILFGLTCVFYGWSHFAYADYTAGMVPKWLPGPLGFAYFTGLGHMAAGIGIIVGILPRLAATLEATMMSLFGLLVWMPSFFAHPKPDWATPPQNQWSELVVNLVLAAAAWVVVTSLRNRTWGLRRS
jgi:uncharacterized membrane protein YphA (DoxX/SURF4 family)